ncbi:MAG: DNA mismatch repair protein MutS [Candidatus Omnitrophica bacterium]|nr:DNA mismatch repair protein MutS [Candidatus Omnitrophota bacterium]
MENLTPMLKQYNEIKAKHPDCILFFRLGDFYEMFYADAQKASKILDLVLTSRSAGQAGKIPMCGIPYHAADSYISRLIKAGEKIAICEQTEDPKEAKGIVQREIIRVITSGTFIDEQNPDSRYVFSFIQGKDKIGISFLDLSGGTIYTNQYTNIQEVINIIYKLPVWEIIFPASEENKIKEIFSGITKTKNILLSPFHDWTFNPDMAKKSLCEHFGVQNLNGFGMEELTLSHSSAGALLEYLKELNKKSLLHIDKISIYHDAEYVFISPYALYGLDIEELLKTIDRTTTAMGKRMFKHWLYHPLKNPEKILQRQKASIILKENPSIQNDLSIIFKSIPDIEKSLSRISCGFFSAKDLLALRNSLSLIPDIKKTLEPISQVNEFFILNDIPEIRIFLEESINPALPVSNPEGKIIKEGYNKELDELRDIQENGRNWLKNLQAEEIKKTHINSLKIGFNNVFGYYIEISRANLHLVPPDYIRKQTLVNAERFITSQLKEFEEKMLSAEEKILEIEKRIIEDICKKILENSEKIHIFSTTLATLDVLHSLSRLASLPGYTAPEITNEFQIIINDGRHPIVEKYVQAEFTPNDTLLDCGENHLLIITGPNMSGKSTYIRQNALIVIMAQMGGFVPASSASIGIVDKIFTRIGAHDEIIKGQSTFMVEMSETADILNNLSERSLIVLDEIGRGTSTYDGLSLAWAIAEYLAKKKVRVLFATHFHELTILQEEFPGIKNYNVEVREWQNEIIFLHKIIPGGTDESYGIYVAKIAGMPQEVIKHSAKILEKLELDNNFPEKFKKGRKKFQMDLFSDSRTSFAEKLKEEISAIDTNNLTPLEALHKIYQWKKKIKGEESE